MSRALPTLAFAAVCLCFSPADAWAEEVRLEVFTGPESKDLKPPWYPRERQRESGEGWVQLNFMIDVSGKPYEIAVTDSMGHPSFERAAIRALKKSSFEPAKLDDQPLDAGHAMKYVFALSGPSAGPRRQAVAAYRRLTRAVEQDEREGAERELAAIEQLRKRNLREDALIDVGKYNYYRKWGSVRQQLQALDRAIAYEASAKYLPEKMFAAAHLSRFSLLVETRDYGRALRAFDTLRTLELDEQTLQALQATVGRIEALRDDERSFSVPGEIEDSAKWDYRLLKNDFAIEDVQGEIAEVKLRCARNYVFFRFEPNIKYHIADNNGPCLLTLVGDPGTVFMLTQM